MKIIVDKLPENPLECIFSRINTGARRCAHNAKICPLTRGEECPFLTDEVTLETELAIEHSEDVEPSPAPKKRTSKRSTVKKAE